MLRSVPLLLVVAVLFAGCGAQGASASSSPSKAPASSTAETSPHWVHYKDLTEGAFTMDVPAGWQVQGGMWRFGYFDARWMMTVRPLDGAMVIRMDDVSVPPYALPGPSTGAAGQAYDKPQQFQMMVADYTSGADYAKIYAKERFRSVCKSLTPRSGTAWKPTIPASDKLPSNTQQVTQGSVSYDCDSSSGHRIATVYAVTTQLAASYGTGYWVVDPLISVLTTKQDEKASYAIAQHMLNSWQKNPAWVAYQNQLTKMGLDQIQANYQQFLQQTQAQMASFESSMNAQVNGFESREQAQSDQVHSFDENLVGIQDMSDPLTGESLQVFSGPHSNEYRNGLGQVINSDVSPGPDFHQINPSNPQ